MINQMLSVWLAGCCASLFIQFMRLFYYLAGHFRNNYVDHGQVISFCHWVDLFEVQISGPVPCLVKLFNVFFF